MKITFRSFCAAIALLAGSVQADEPVSLAPKFEPFAEKPAAFAEPPITLVGCNDGCADACADSCCDNGSCCSNGGCCPSSRHVGRDFWVCRDRCPGLIGGFEALLIRPYGSNGLFDPAAGGGGVMNFNPAWRLWVGTQNCDGFGGRLRYFDYNRGASTGGAAPTVVSAQFRTFDAELTQAVDFRRWNLLFAGGLRWAQTGVANSSGFGTAADSFATAAGFHGAGLTFGTQAATNLTRSGSWRMVFGGRWSAVYGQSNATTFGGAVIPVSNDLVSIFETNIGPQYRKLLRNGSYLTMGGGLEAQYWNNAINTQKTIGAGGSNGSAFDVGFFGLTTNIAITR